MFKTKRGEEEGAEPDALKVICQYDSQLTASANGNVMAIDDEHLRFWVRRTEGCVIGSIIWTVRRIS